MTKEEHKIELQKLKNNLYNNYAIYHERVTLLVQLTKFEIGNDEVNFKVKIVKPLDKEFAENNRLYHRMLEEDEISLGATYLIGDIESSSILNRNKIGRPHCPFTLWLDPDLTKFVSENEDKITREIPNYILDEKDWTELKQK